MRIVYDDERENEVIKMFNSFFGAMNTQTLKNYIKYDYGTERVQSSLIKQGFNDTINRAKFEIGKTVTHLHGIGNNCCHPIYYKGNPTELQTVSYININSGLYGEVFVYITNYNGERVSKSFELSKWGIK